MAPDAKQLLELLQRAADELKTAQKEASVLRIEANAAKAESANARTESAALRAELTSAHEAARLERKDFEDQLKALQSALNHEKTESRRLKSELDAQASLTLRPGAVTIGTKTVTMQKPPVAMRARDDKTNVNESDADLLGDRMKGLQDEIAQLEKDKRELKERIRQLELDLATPKESPEAVRQLGELEHQLSNARQQLIVEQARGADLLTRLQAWEVRANELEVGLATATTTAHEEHAQLEQLAGQLSQVETELTTERARTTALQEQLESIEQGASDEQKKVLEATSRIAQLEVEIVGLKGRRDELNIEIGKVENERNAARARAAELETAARDVEARLTAAHRQQVATEHQKRTELEQSLAREKDKHQITAQKLLEARGRQRETDEHVQTLTQRYDDLVKSSAARDAELRHAIETEQTLREQALVDLQGHHEANVAQLQQQVVTLTQQLEQATGEWRHVERQYEALHREMLVILDQRDTARQELDTIKARLGLR